MTHPLRGVTGFLGSKNKYFGVFLGTRGPFCEEKRWLTSFFFWPEGPHPRGSVRYCMFRRCSHPVWSQTVLHELQHAAAGEQRRGAQLILLLPRRAVDIKDALVMDCYHRILQVDGAGRPLAVALAMCLLGLQRSIFIGRRIMDDMIEDRVSYEWGEGSNFSQIGKNQIFVNNFRKISKPLSFIWSPDRGWPECLYPNQSIINDPGRASYEGSWRVGNFFSKSKKNQLQLIIFWKYQMFTRGKGLPLIQQKPS